MSETCLIDEGERSSERMFIHNIACGTLKWIVYYEDVCVCLILSMLWSL